MRQRLYQRLTAVVGLFDPAEHPREMVHVTVAIAWIGTSQQHGTRMHVRWSPGVVHRSFQESYDRRRASSS
jgi:hypothetical protein